MASGPARKPWPGGRFLGLFLETLGAPWPADVCEKATARTEFFVGNGSIDVYVKSACGILAIENKPWAGDQAKQLHRYFAHLAQAGLIKYCIVYLTEDGRDPPADSICESERTLRIEAEQLRLWSYPGKIVEWLTRCRNACRADRVVVFIDEFIRYIQQEFQGVRDMTTQEHLVEKVTGSPEMILPAMQVAFAGDAIRNKLLSMLHNQLETAVRKQGWIDVEWEMDAYSRDSYLGIDFSPKCPSKFGLQFEETRFRNPYYGAYKKDMTRADDGGVGSALVGLGQARQNDEWPWYRDASSRKRRSSAATEARNR